MSTQSLSAALARQLSPPALDVSQQPDHIKLLNTSGRRIAFGVSTTLRKATTTPTGVLDPNEAVMLIVKCEGDEKKDQVTIVYTFTPEGSDKQYRSEYFLDPETLVTRKNMSQRFPKITAVLAKFEKAN